MRITGFIRETITGKDATLSMFDIAGHIYGTRSPSKSQLEAINQAITTVADDINIIATYTFDNAIRLVFNPLSDKSTLIACEKRKRDVCIQHTDSKVWKDLSKKERGQSFGEIDTRTKLLAAKARDPMNALQIEKDYEIEREAYFSARNVAKCKKASPTIDDAAKALNTLYNFARSLGSADDLGTSEENSEKKETGRRLQDVLISINPNLKLNIDRRAARSDRRVNKDRNYKGQARRNTIDRRLNLKDRRKKG